MPEPTEQERILQALLEGEQARCVRLLNELMKMAGELRALRSNGGESARGEASEEQR